MKIGQRFTRDGVRYVLLGYTREKMRCMREDSKQILYLLTPETERKRKREVERDPREAEKEREVERERRKAYRKRKREAERERGKRYREAERKAERKAERERREAEQKRREATNRRLTAKRVWLRFKQEWCRVREDPGVLGQFAEVQLMIAFVEKRLKATRADLAKDAWEDILRDLHCLMEYTWEPSRAIEEMMKVPIFRELAIDYLTSLAGDPATKTQVAEYFSSGSNCPDKPNKE